MVAKNRTKGLKQAKQLGKVKALKYSVNPPNPTRPPGGVPTKPEGPPLPSGD